MKREGEVSIEDATRLFDFLSEGKTDDGVRSRHLPKLGKKKAFAVIYYLQEIMQLIPDHYEQCCVCLRLYDDWSEGHYDDKTGRNYCDNCRRD